MTEITPSPLNNVISIDDKRIKNHVDRVVRGSVAEMTLTFVGSSLSLDQGHLEDFISRRILSFNLRVAGYWNVARAEEMLGAENVR